MCTSTDPEAFFPDRYDGPEARLAMRICGECPVRAECLAESLATREVHEGIWGGLPPSERRRLLGIARRQRRASRRPA